MRTDQAPDENQLKIWINKIGVNKMMLHNKFLCMPEPKEAMATSSGNWVGHGLGGTTWSQRCTSKPLLAMLSATLCLIGMVFSQSAFAQNQPSTQAEAEIVIEEAVIEEVVVTGSNISRDAANLSTSFSSQIVDDELIEGVAALTVSDALDRVPFIVSDANRATSNNDTGGNAGIVTTSLRNLGASRTLVLVNGRRYVSGSSAGNGYGVDLNSIPTGIVERIDILTGGQSAIYGSDAIAGVVNIITKQDFEGAELNIYGSDSEAGGANRQNIDFTFGRNFDGGNVWASLGYAKQESLLASQRDISRYSVAPQDTDGDGKSEAVGLLGSSFVPGARIIGGGISIKGDGSPFNGAGPVVVGGQLQGDTDRLNFNEFRHAIMPLDRLYVASGLRLDFSDQASAEFEVNYAQTSSSTRIEPVPINVVADSFRGGQVPPNTSTGLDIATSPLFVGSSAGQQLVDALLGEDGPGSTDLANVTTFRRGVEFGQLGIDVDRSTFRVAGAFNYEFDNGFLSKTSVVYGVTNQDQTNFGDVNLERLRESVLIEPDGSGGYRCVNAVARSNGCVPANPFGTADSQAGMAGIIGFSEEAVEYIALATGQTGEVEQIVLSSVMSGDLPFSITEDPISFATGVEYRREAGKEIPDSARQRVGISRRLRVLPTDGSFHVAEVFGEMLLPVAEFLDLNFALRLADYSTVGNATTWRVGFDAPINDWIQLRGSQSRSVRAPNVSDLFAGGSAGVGTNVDVCRDVDNNTAGNRGTNCRSIASVAARIAELGSFQLEQFEFNNTRVLEVGSPLLQEETADSTSLGVVVAPMDALTLSMDYFDIKVEDAIRIIDGRTLVERCHDVDPSVFDSTCGGAVERQSNGPILNLNTVANNLDTIRTSGLDLGADYVPLDNLSLNFLATWVDEYSVTPPSGVKDDRVGEVLYPEFRMTLNMLYDISDHWNLFTQIRWRDETVNNPQNSSQATPLSDALNTLDSAIYVDFRVSYALNDQFSMYLGANNLLNEEPDLIPNGTNTTPFNGTNTDPRAYDIIGRQYFAGLKYQFQ